MSVDTNSTRLRKCLLTATAVLVALLLPVVAFAIPGSGDFVALESSSGRDLTELYNIIAKICLIILLIVEGVLLVAIFKFRRRSEDEQPEQVHGDLKLEVGWTLAALALQVYIGFITIDVMFEVETLPETDITVEAVAYQWDWEFRYPDQGITHEDLVVPANTNVRLEVTSRDVIHSIFIPELGVKMDAVPGRFNPWWFNADGPINTRGQRIERRVQEPEDSRHTTTRPDWWQYFTLQALPDYEDQFYIRDEQTPAGGLERRVGFLGASRDASQTKYSGYTAIEYRGMCTELCGRDHWDMYFRTVAMTPSDFEQWVEDKKTGDPGEVDGEQIYESRCASCHNSDGQGEEGTYPPLAGARYTTDEEYQREHVDIVLNGLEGEIEVLGETYDGVMQSFESLNDAEVAAVVNHERTSWGNDGGEVDEDFVAQVREESGLDPFPAGGAEPVEQDELIDVGQRVYSSCVSCHGEDGRGLDTVPDLVENPTVMGDIDSSVEVLDKGVDTPDWPGRQPPMGRQMSDRQMAGVLTYIRNSFGNEASAVQPDEVKRIREEMD